MNPKRIRNRRRLAALVALSGLGVLGGLASPAGAFAAHTAGRPDVVQHRLDALVNQDGFPAALASVTTRNGRARNYTAGVGDITTHSAVPVDGQVRIGSNTKVFTP